MPTILLVVDERRLNSGAIPREELMDCRILLFAPIIAASAYAGEPGESVNLIEPSLREQLGMAMVELAFGDHQKARARAEIAAAPERLTFFFDTSQVDAWRGAELRDWALSGIQYWNSNGMTRFREVFDKSSADLVIEFKDRIRGRVGAFAGYVTSRRTASYSEEGVSVKINALVEISNRAPGGRLTSREQVSKAVAHELGHILGLEDGHDSRDLMGPVPTSGGSARNDAFHSALEDVNTRARSIIEATPTARAAVSGYVP